MTLVLATLASADATTLWANRTGSLTYGTPGWEDVLVLDTGRIVATTTIDDPAKGPTAIVRCWNQDGTTLWTYEYPDPENDSVERGKKLALDPNGTIVFVGFRDTAPGVDVLYARLDQDGNELDCTYDLYAGGYEFHEVPDLVIDSNGLIYTGFEGVSHHQWVVLLPDFTVRSQSVEHLHLTDIEILASGRVVQAGHYEGQAVFQLYDPIGLVLTRPTIEGATRVLQVIGDSQSDFFVLADDESIHRYNLDARERYRFNVSLFDTGQSCIAFHEASDSLYVFDEESSTDNILLRKFNGQGQLQWTESKDADLADGKRLIQSDKYGNAVLVATNGEHDPDTDIRAWCFSAEGKFQWANGTTNTPNSDNEPVDFGIDDKCRLVVVGLSRDLSTNEPYGFAWRTSQSFREAPDSATVRLGRNVAGDMDSLTTVDDDEYTVCRFIVPNQQIRPINVEFDVAFPIGNANPGNTTLTVHTVQSGNSPNLVQWIQLYEWSTGTWTSSQNYTLSSVKQTYDVTFHNLGPYFQGSGTHIRARLVVGNVGPVAALGICTSVDEFHFLSDTD